MRREFLEVPFSCSVCLSRYQLKSTKGKFGTCIPDGAFGSIIESLKQDRAPNILIMKYDVVDWKVSDLKIIPFFGYSEQAIIKRKPLSDNARRAGWIGCNIDLRSIPNNFLIDIIKNGHAIAPEVVHKNYSNVKPLQEIKPEARGWTIIMLNLIQSYGDRVFTTNESYRFEDFLADIFPNNSNIRPKIRQQLQVLRDMGFISKEGRGEWRLISK
jgi:type II restriction enzyme